MNFLSFGFTLFPPNQYDVRYLLLYRLVHPIVIRKHVALEKSLYNCCFWNQSFPPDFEPTERQSQEIQKR